MNEKLTKRPIAIFIVPSSLGSADAVRVSSGSITVVRDRRPVKIGKFRGPEVKMHLAGNYKNGDKLVIQIKEVMVKKGGVIKTIKVDSTFVFYYDNGWN